MFSTVQFCKFAATRYRRKKFRLWIGQGSAKLKKLATAVMVPANDPIYYFHSTTGTTFCKETETETFSFSRFPRVPLRSPWADLSTRRWRLHYRSAHNLFLALGLLIPVSSGWPRR